MLTTRDWVACGGCAGELTSAVTSRILAWEELCAALGMRGYISRHVSRMAGQSAGCALGGSQPAYPVRLRIAAPRLRSSS